ncbi:hypothetical protein E2K80_02920 [Rhodophyticola sp. CCM32]|uniref:hypothetical protein n=1 Tax=Rhodophyticola sp. CCM32 TaxID=2916397 RepID=UPI00107FC967|nr:hypothetical protein [Rhodophyticola sp. CCM32]QBX99809.1 hypothetical protein E2K80_02920 [Rhodophyticola sp. CCM32]
MSDTADMEKISALEGRLAAALDRIAAGMGSLRSQGRGEVEAATAALEAAEARAAELAARLSETEGADGAALAETQVALAAEQAAQADLTEQLRALEASRQASQDELARVAAAHEDQLAELKGELEEARTANEELRGKMAELDAAAGSVTSDPADIETITRLEGEVVVLRRRAKRLRTESQAAQQARDEAQDALDELRAREGDGGAETTLRGELRQLRLANAALRDASQEMRQIAARGDAVDPDLLNAAMAAELVTLKAERAADAAEMQDILDELTPLVSGDNANA